MNSFLKVCMVKYDFKQVEIYQNKRKVHKNV